VLVVELDRPDHGVELGRRQRLLDLGLVGGLGAQQDVAGDLEQRVDEAERLGPLVRKRRDEIGGGLAGERRLERVRRAPPDLGRQALCEIAADRFDGGGEQDRLADARDLGFGPAGALRQQAAQSGGGPNLGMAISTLGTR
jgi:hypothetical protein